MKAAVIGAGPAGLMAAEVLANAGLSVTVFDAKPSPARKFLMAGKSGLNLTFDGDFDKLLSGYGNQADDLHAALQAFDNKALASWAEGLGQELFVGSTGRVFPKSMKASPLLRAWLVRLTGLGVELKTRHRWQGWDAQSLTFEIPDGRVSFDPDVTVLACGGASWARLGSDGAWASLLPETVPFSPSNAGVCVDWSQHMSPHFGAAIKSVKWSAAQMSSRGEAILSARGLEGGGVYALTPALRAGASLRIDLLPDRELDWIAGQFSKKPRKATLSNWLKKGLKLPPVKIAVVQEFARNALPQDALAWAGLLKDLPIPLTGLAPIDEAISTSGGVAFDGLDAQFMLRARPGVFCAGEMIEWDAPTGGWLLTACFATGAWAGTHAAAFAKALG